MYNKIYSNLKKIIKENIFLIIFTIIVLIVLNISLPFYIEAPGGIISLKDKMMVNGKYLDVKDINLSYVSVYDGNVTTYILSKINKNWDIVPIKEYVLDGENKEDSDKRNKILLDNSLSNAYFAAFTALKRKADIIDSNTYVIGVLSDNTNLKIGDKINSIDNIKINSTKEISDYISKKRPNEKIIINVNDNVEKYAIINDDNKLNLILVTNYNYKDAIEFKFKKGESGSSGGLMVTLSIYNAYTNEDITKNMKIAGTGTISLNGEVGEISGIKYKLLAAEGVDLFFLPMKNYEEAKNVIEEYNLKINVVAVSTFDEVINYLKNYS